jgi:pimeloyl-ACP methyl ester carboxylesterase
VHHITKRTVVSVDARNHGDSPHSSDMSYSHMAKDVKHMLGHLNMDKISFMGKLTIL